MVLSYVYTTWRLHGNWLFIFYHSLHISSVSCALTDCNSPRLCLALKSLVSLYAFFFHSFWLHVDMFCWMARLFFFRVESYVPDVWIYAIVCNTDGRSCKILSCESLSSWECGEVIVVVAFMCSTKVFFILSFYCGLLTSRLQWVQWWNSWWYWLLGAVLNESYAGCSRNESWLASKFMTYYWYCV